jgi:hydrogenase-1 operon protein HyaF
MRQSGLKKRQGTQRVPTARGALSQRLAQRLRRQAPQAAPVRAAANSSGSKGWRSSIPSPTPTAWIGSPNRSASATSTPPFVAPLRAPEAAEPRGFGPTPAPARRFLADLARRCRLAAETSGSAIFRVERLGTTARIAVRRALGEGGVSLLVEGAPRMVARETRFPGVWRVRLGEIDLIELGPTPAPFASRAHLPLMPPRPPARAGAGVLAAPAIVAELLGRASEDAARHVVALTDRPHTPADLAHLEAAFGRGMGEALCLGREVCRIDATATPRIWRVRHFNANDALIYDAFEVAALPTLARAEAQDLAESAEALAALADVLP